MLTAHVYSSFSTVTTAKCLSPAHTCCAMLPPLNMSSFCGVNFPPPQKYTSRERVVTTAIDVSVAVFNLEEMRNKTSQGSRDVETLVRTDGV